MRFDVFRTTALDKRTGTLVINGADLAFTTEDGELASLLAEIKRQGAVMGLDSEAAEGYIADVVRWVTIAETPEFLSWLRRELLGWQVIPSAE
jgi:hypothetical protein